MISFAVYMEYSWGEPTVAALPDSGRRRLARMRSIPGIVPGTYLFLLDQPDDRGGSPFTRRNDAHPTKVLTGRG